MIQGKKDDLADTSVLSLDFGLHTDGSTGLHYVLNRLISIQMSVYMSSLMSAGKHICRITLCVCGGKVIELRSRIPDCVQCVTYCTSSVCSITRRDVHLSVSQIYLYGEHGDKVML